MAKPVSRKFVAAHRFYQPRHLSRSASHKRTFERAKTSAVQNPGGNSHDVFRRRANLAADYILAIIKSDKFAFKFVGKFADEFGVISVDNHTIRFASGEFLNMSGAYPHGCFILIVTLFDHYFGKSFARVFFKPLHTKDYFFIFRAVGRDFAGKLS